MSQSSALSPCRIASWNIALAMGAAGLAPGCLAGQQPAFARLQANNIVEVLDIANGRARQVYQSRAWRTSDLTMSPDGQRLAVLEWTEGVVRDHDYAVLPASRLIVLDLQGRELALVASDVQRYAWCGATCIAFVSGSYREEGEPDFVATGVWSAEIGSTPRRLPAPPSPVALSWSTSDGALYVRNRAPVAGATVFRIDLRTNTMHPTALHDVRISPTGRYYLFRPELGDSVILYETATNSPVDLSSVRRQAVPLEWASDKEDLLLLRRRAPARVKSPANTGIAAPRREAANVASQVTYQIYDVRGHGVRRSVTGALDRWTGPDHRHVVHVNGRYEVLDQP